ncbi:hypothetical protein K2X33_15115, partial [bacterium]|nr:hypothetical protein [bacterium]
MFLSTLLAGLLSPLFAATSAPQVQIPLLRCPAVIAYAKDLAYVSAQKDKYFQRVLFSGGPIAQPEFFYRLMPLDRSAFAQPEDVVSDSSANPIPGAPEISMESLIAKLLSEEITKPLVFKPNRGMQGDRIFFLEPRGHEFVVTFSTSYITRTWLDFSKLESRFPIRFIHGSEDTKTQSFAFAKSALEQPVPGNVLFEIWKAASVVRRQEAVLAPHFLVGWWWRLTNWRQRRQVDEMYQQPDFYYDSGMVETYENDVFRPEGRAYETRHRLIRTPGGRVGT